MEGRELALVTYQFPPIGGSGVQRALKLARYLPRSGWAVHVVTAGHVHYPLLDPTQADGIGDGVRVHRVCGLEPAAVATALCRHLRLEGGGGEWADDIEERLYWRLDWMCGGLRLPETEMLWMPAAIRRVRRLLERHPIAAVVTTSPPHSTHLVGLALKRRLGVPWIADLRDPILDNFAYHGEAGVANRFWQWLERKVLQDADHVVVTCPELADRWRARYPDIDASRFTTITNGFDPADALVPMADGDRAGARVLTTDTDRTDARAPMADANRAGADEKAKHERRFIISYVGAFYREQTIDPVLQAVRQLRAARADVARDLEFRMVGSVSASQRRLLCDDDRLFFRDVGYQSHEEAIAEMTRADVLLLMTPANDGGRLCIPAKMFEYLRFGGHVIAVAHEGTTMWRVLQEAGNVSLLSSWQPSDLAGAMERCYDRWRVGLRPQRRNLEVLEPFRRDRLAARFAEVVDRCVAGAVGGHTRTREAVGAGAVT